MAAFKQNVESWKNKLLHEKNAFFDVLDKLQAKTRVRRLYIALGFVALVALYLMVGYGVNAVFYWPNLLA